MKNYRLFLLIVILLAGCAAQPQANTQVPKGGITPQPGSTSQGETSTPVIVLERSGGLAGGTEQWTVYADGRVISGKNVETRINTTDLTRLLTTLKDTGFFDLPNQPKQPSTCNDCFNYTLTVNYQGQSKSVTIVEGDSNTPAQLTQILGEVNQLISGSQKP